MLELEFVVKLLENQAEHLLCTTSVRVNRLREVSDQRYNPLAYQASRREAIRQLDLQHDYEEKPKAMTLEHEHYFTHPVSVSDNFVYLATSIFNLVYYTKIVPDHLGFCNVLT